MPVLATFHEFAKKPQSTAQPQESDIRYDCELKQPFDLLSPTLILHLDDVSPIGWNYVHIPVLSRYYYITDWTYNSGRWFASTRVDTLASWKAEIGECKPYILRAASHFNAFIIDDRYPATTNPQKTTVSPRNFGGIWYNQINEGTYVVGIVAGDSNAGGAITYYGFTRSQFDLFRRTIYGNADWLNISPDELSVSLQKALVNPFDYITVSHWLPVNASTIGAQNLVTEIKLGWWTFPASAYKIPGNFVQTGVVWEFNLPDRPHQPGEEISGFGWEFASPLSEYSLILPVFGTIPISPQIVAPQLKLVVTAYIDLVSGVCNLRLSSNTDTPQLQYLSTKIAVDIPLYGRTSNPLGAVGGIMSTASGAIQAAASVAVGNPAAAISAIGTVADGVGNALKANAPTLHEVGRQGSFSEFAILPQLICVYYTTVNRDPEHFGRPWCASGRAVKEFEGYLLCAGADPEIPATETERDEIVASMNGGFFYE